MVLERHLEVVGLEGQVDLEGQVGLEVQVGLLYLKVEQVRLQEEEVEVHLQVLVVGLKELVEVVLLILEVEEVVLLKELMII